MVYRIGIISFSLILLLICFLSCGLNNEKKKQYSDINTVDYILESTDYDFSDEVLTRNNKIGKTARKKYKKSCKIAGDFLVSKYKEGLCINKYLGKEGTNNNNSKLKINIKIPELIDGKKVLKIGCYLKKEKHYYCTCGPFSNIFAYESLNVFIPKTVKCISEVAFQPQYRENGEFYSGIINNIEVSNDNEFFSSQDGCLYSKKKTRLLYKSYRSFDDTDIDSLRYFKIPDTVICVSKCIFDDSQSIIIGKNVKKIDAYFFEEPEGYYEVKGYKNSTAEKWAKKWGLQFIELD